MTTIFLFGSNGMLGNYINSYLSQYYKIYSLTRKDYDLSQINICSLENLLVNEKGLHEGDIIINCSGVIPQSSKERNLNTKLYFTINSIFPVILSQICDKCGAKMLHITTDCVFSGKDGLYNELSVHDETNDYGMSKSLGELCKATIIRTSIIGEEVFNKRSLLEWVKSNQGKEINGFTQHFWNGVTCLQLAEIIYKIIKDNLYWSGVRHIFSPRSVSKYELVNIINEIYNLDIIINPFETEKVDKTLTTVYDTNSVFQIPDLKDQILKLNKYIDMLNLSTKINYFTIMGERCSGTNYIEEMITLNFDINITWNYGWKHWFGFYNFKNDIVENQTLFVGIIRDPIEWIDSLFKHKIHIPLENHDIEKFLFNKWFSVDENGNEINYENSIYKDINYITKENFKNIFELRKIKNHYLKNEMPKNVKNYILINYNNFILDPVKKLTEIKEKFNLDLKNKDCINYENYTYDKNQKFIKNYTKLDEKYIKLIKDNLDIEQEVELGFSLN